MSNLSSGTGVSPVLATPTRARRPCHGNAFNKFLQIALTYTCPLPLRIWAVCFIAFAIWLLCVREMNYGLQMAILMIGGMLAAFLGATIPAHAKEQLADARSSLTPHYRAPHLIVAAIFFVAGLGGVVAFTMWRYHQVPRTTGWITVDATFTGLLAITLFWAAALSWMSHYQLLKIIFVVIGLGVFSATPPGLWFNSDILSGHSPVLAYAIIAIATAAMIALWWRLAVMHEEMHEYFRLEQLNTRLRVQMTGDRFFRRASAAETGPTTDWMSRTALLDRVGNMFNASFWRRVQHWRLVTGIGRISMLAPILVALTVLAAVVTDERGRTKDDDDFLLHFPMVIGLVLPIITAGAGLPRRWYMLATESLRPATREQYLREHGAAFAVELAITWAWATVGGYLPTLIFKPELFLTYTFVACVLLTAAAQVWFFAVAIWLLRWRGSLFSMGIAFGLVCLGTLAIVAKQFEAGPRIDLTRGPSPLLALALVIAGLVVAYDAYRRWMVTDLD